MAKALGFTDAEIGRIKGGKMIQKDLKKDSDKELVGVVAVFFNKPVANWVEAAMQGKMLETDKNTQAFRVWKPDASADEAFADVGLSATDTGEAKIILHRRRLSRSAGRGAGVLRQPHVHRSGGRLRQRKETQHWPRSNVGLNHRAPKTHPRAHPKVAA